MVCLIRQLAGFGERPHRDDRISGDADGCALRHNQKAGARLAGSQVIAKVIQHGPTIMRHQYAALGRCTVEQFRIAKTVEPGLLG